MPDRSVNESSVVANGSGGSRIATGSGGAGMRSESLGISAAEASALLGVSESHFYCLHKTGRLGPLPVRMGRAVRWSRQELVNWFNAGSPPRSRWQAIKRNGDGR